MRAHNGPATRMQTLDLDTYQFLITVHFCEPKNEPLIFQFNIEIQLKMKSLVDNRNRSDKMAPLPKRGFQAACIENQWHRHNTAL